MILTLIMGCKTILRFMTWKIITFPKKMIMISNSYAWRARFSDSVKLRNKLNNNLSSICKLILKSLNLSSKQ